MKAKLNISSETFSNYRCSNKYYLKRHIVRHTAERQFKCEFEGCGKSFFDQHVLRSHEKIHLGIKDFHCTLSVHMKRHNGIILHFNVCQNVPYYFAGEKPQVCGVWKRFCGAKWSKKMQARFVIEIFLDALASLRPILFSQSVSQ